MGEKREKEWEERIEERGSHPQFLLSMFMSEP